jgi:hypothetical protein
MLANASENAKYFMLEEIGLNSKYTKLSDVPCGKAVPLNWSVGPVVMKVLPYYMWWQPARLQMAG